MKFFTLVAALAAAISSAAASLTINTPTNVVECQPTQLQWSGGTPPYYLAAIPAGQTAATPFETFPTQNGTSYTWTVDLGAGTSLSLSLKDSTGAQAYSDIVTIGPGTSTSCANTSVGSSGATTVAGSGSTAGSTAAAGSGATSASSATTTASGSTSTQSSAAGRLSVSSAFGVAGVMGLVGAALF